MRAMAAGSATAMPRRNGSGFWEKSVFGAMLDTECHESARRPAMRARYGCLIEDFPIVPSPGFRPGPAPRCTGLRGYPSGPLAGGISDDGVDESHVAVVLALKNHRVFGHIGDEFWIERVIHAIVKQVDLGHREIFQRCLGARFPSGNSRHEPHPHWAINALAGRILDRELSGLRGAQSLVGFFKVTLDRKSVV